MARGLVALAALAAVAGPRDGDAQPLLVDPPGHVSFRTFAAADGLRNLELGTMAQDIDGALWIATGNGLYRYNGDQMTHYGVPEGLPSSYVYMVAMDSRGRPCASGFEGIACWDNGRFSRAGLHGLPSDQVIAIAARAGVLWVGTRRSGLYVQDRAGGFVPAPGWPSSARHTINAIVADDFGLAVNDRAQVQLTTGDGTWRVFRPPSGDRVDALMRARNGALWIRTSGHLWVLPPGSTEAYDVGSELPVTPEAGWVTGILAQDARGRILVATERGLAIRDGERWELIDRSRGLAAQTVDSVFVDREGTIWLGANGLRQMRGRGLVEHHGPETGLPGEKVWTIGRDPRGALWIGTSECLVHAVERRWQCLPGTTGREVRAIAFTRDGGMFYAGVPTELLHVDASGRATSLGTVGDGEVIMALVIASDGDLYVGTNAGVFRVHGAVPGPIQRVMIPEAAADTWSTSLIADGERLWVNTVPTGFAVLDRGTWHAFHRDVGLHDSRPTHLLIRADGRVCTAYAEALGVTCFRYHDGALTNVEHLRAGDQLTDGDVYYLGEDQRHRLWVASGSGVDIIGPEGTDHVDDTDGLASNNAMHNAFFRDDDGSVWLGASGGLTHLDATRYERLPPPRVAVAAGQPGELDRVATAGRLELTHDRNDLSIDLSASSLSEPRHIELEFRLLPLESRWNPTRQRQQRFPALQPGSYRFEARARIGRGAWGPVTALTFVVLPAWWQTRWFFALAVLAALAVIASGFAIRQRIVVRRRIRQLHERSDASFGAVVDAIPDLIYCYRDGALFHLNDPLCQLLGLRDDGRSRDLELAQRIHPDDRAAHAALLANARDRRPGDHTGMVEIRFQTSAGTWRSCEISVQLVEIAGKPTVVASGRDVTESKRMRAQLLIADRMASLGTLAAGIAHEINNPLTYVASNLEFAAEQLAEPGASPEALHDELVAVLRDAQDGAERVRKIVLGLRTFSRAEEETRQLLELPVVIDNAIRLTANEVRHRAVLVCERGAVPEVIADDGRLTQVFINLLINAAHAIPEGRSDHNRITVRTSTDDEGLAVIDIEDTGSGMTAEVLSRVFDPFFTTKRVGAGTGLGLSICHGIIGGLGGQIIIDSALGRGTRVRVTLPAGSPAGNPVVEAAPAPAADAATRHRVMLVDDESSVAAAARRLRRDSSRRQ